jgi:hypothetical protein
MVDVVVMKRDQIATMSPLALVLVLLDSCWQRSRDARRYFVEGYWRLEGIYLGDGTKYHG